MNKAGTENVMYQRCVESVHAEKCVEGGVLSTSHRSNRDSSICLFEGKDQNNCFVSDAVQGLGSPPALICVSRIASLVREPCCQGFSKRYSCRHFCEENHQVQEEGAQHQDDQLVAVG